MLVNFALLTQFNSLKINPKNSFIFFKLLNIALRELYEYFYFKSLEITSGLILEEKLSFIIRIC